jgi:hypothetical protein
MSDFHTGDVQPPEPSSAGGWRRATDPPGEETSKNYSWGRNLPALRLNRSPEAERASRPSQSGPIAYHLKPPWYLRLVRLLLGLGLLAGAWGLAMVTLAWGQSVLANVPQMWTAEWSDLYFALNVAGALLLAVVTLTVFVVGAFSLLMGLIARGW